MPKIIKIEPHLSLEELETGYRQAKELVLRTHYQIIWLLAKGMSTQEVAVVTGYSRSWIYELVWGYNRSGIETLGDQSDELITKNVNGITIQIYISLIAYLILQLLSIPTQWRHTLLIQVADYEIPGAW
ncbi:helix-turn-helix domain-containing protein [Nostoc sp.]|uniref:helix-turn-helix domain-containing protein n=1 Tax=Nostoc sp. TaxID=1180 RepID=UPI001E1477B0|nr:helix-turn-helix domain-containing protein [Nostoc sp. JL34]